VAAQPIQNAPAALLEGHIAAETDKGRKRGNNEDRLLVFDLKRQRELSAVKTEVVVLRPRGVLLVVADGMGGMSAGETASQMTVENFLTTYLDRSEPPPSGIVTNDDRRNALTESVRDTNALVYARATAEKGLKGMGTTLTAALIEGDHMFIAQVGDSRAYLLRGGELTQLTHDQTLLASLQAKGGDLPVNANAQWKNMLLQAVGAQPDVQVALTETALQPGDRLMLCSDGLHGPVKREEILDLMQGATPPEDRAKGLISRANENGGPDNISVVVCDVHAVGQ
jgi:protein phosphatase